MEKTKLDWETCVAFMQALVDAGVTQQHIERGVQEAARLMPRVAAVLQGNHVPVSELAGISVRTRNTIEKMGIRTIDEIAQFTPQQFLGQKNFSERLVQELREALAGRGLKLLGD